MRNGNLLMHSGLTLATEPGGYLAFVGDVEVIEKIRTHVEVKAAEPEASMRPPRWVPHQRGLFD